MHRTTSCVASRRRTGRRGFTLVEVLVAAAIMGMVFVSIMEAFKTGLEMLEQSQHMTIGSTLADEIHQMTLMLPLRDPELPLNWGAETGESLPFDDVDDLDDQTFQPPVNADGAAISGLDDYAQQVTVVCVSASDFDVTVGDGASGVSRVTAVVTYRGEEVCRMSWLVVGHL